MSTKERIVVSQDCPKLLGSPVTCGSQIMFEFHDDYIKNKYGNNSRLLFTKYTDSLMYEIKTEDVYKDFSSDKEMFGFIK